MRAYLRREASLECARGVRNERTLRFRPEAPQAPFAPKLKLWSSLPALQHSKAASPRHAASHCGPKVRANISPVRRHDGLGFPAKIRTAGQRSAQITRTPSHSPNKNPKPAVICADLRPACASFAPKPGPSALRRSDRAGICPDLRPEMGDPIKRQNRSNSLRNPKNQSHVMKSAPRPALKGPDHRSRGQGRCQPPAALGFGSPRTAHPERVLYPLARRAV